MTARIRLASDPDGTRYAHFKCPGCGDHHMVAVGRPNGGRPLWGWNGSLDRPTFTPSVRVTWRDFTAAGETALDAWHDAGCPKPMPKFEAQDFCCHSFVTDGRIQFLSDCTHSLAGQTVDLPSCNRKDSP